MKRLLVCLMAVGFVVGLMPAEAAQKWRSRFRLPISVTGGAAVSTFFSTTFSSAEGFTNDRTHTFCSGNGFNGLQAGLAQGGNFTSGNGNCSQILTTANRAAGDPSSRGFRMYVSDGINSYSGGMVFTFDDMTAFVGTRTTHYWARWWVRYPDGLAINTSGGSHKFAYHALFTCGNHGNGCYWTWEGVDSARLHLGNGGSSDVNASPARGYTTLNGGANNGDDSWHCLEYEVQSESDVNTDDGVVTVWVDGTQWISGTTVDYDNFVDGGFSGVHIPQNGVWTVTGGPHSGDVAMDIDDMAFSTAGRITCS